MTFFLSLFKSLFSYLFPKGNCKKSFFLKGRGGLKHFIFLYLGLTMFLLDTLSERKTDRAIGRPLWGGALLNVIWGGGLTNATTTNKSMIFF